MELGYYPGCSAYGTSIELDLSVRSVFDKMGINLIEIPDWNCCGASPGHVLYEELGLGLSYFNIAKAYTAGIKEILAPCPSCYTNLLKARYYYKNNEEIRGKFSKLFGECNPDEVKIYHLNDFITSIGKENIEKLVVKPLEGLKVAPYYGCLPRLPHVDIDSKENPTLMDEILSWIGAEVVNWPYKVYCCGAGISISKPQISDKLVENILEMASSFSVDAIAVVCPLCQFNIDSREKKLGFNIPVIYLTQLMGVAFGIPRDKLGLDKTFVSAEEVLQRYS